MPAFLLKWFVIILIIVSLGSIAYYFGYFMPQQAKAKLAYQKEQAEKKGVCLADAETNFNNFWKSECSGLGYREGCRLPLDVASRVDSKRQTDKENCFKQYPEVKEE